MIQASACSKLKTRERLSRRGAASSAVAAAYVDQPRPELLLTYVRMLLQLPRPLLSQATTATSRPSETRRSSERAAVTELSHPSSFLA